MCRAPKSMFKAEDEEKPENTEQREIIEDNLESLSPGVLAALFSNLARGSEKQYKEKDAELFRKIAVTLLHLFTQLQRKLLETTRTEELSEPAHGVKRWRE